jgi:hypothetical protein
MKSYLCFLLFLVYATVSLCCNSHGEVFGEGFISPPHQEENQKEEKAMTCQNQFEKVPLNTSEPNPCSPSAPHDPKWRGMLINAPHEVKYNPGEAVDEFGAFAKIPICGYSLLNVPPKPTKERMKLFAIAVKNGEEYSGEVYELDSSPDVPPPDDEPAGSEEIKGMAVGSYFNLNLANFVQLPVEEAVYEVYIEFRKIRSNKVTIRLVAKRD